MSFIDLTVLLSGICWTITYIGLVYRGFKEHTCGMPIAALALNFAWETTFSLIYPSTASAMVVVINVIWMICDLGIVITHFKYGYKYAQEQYGVSKNVFYICSVIGFILAFAIMITGGSFFGRIEYWFACSPREGAKFIAFIQNAIMSVLFIQMFYTRKKYGHGVEGQSFWIAVTKFVGTSLTVGVSICMEHSYDYAFILSLVAICFVFDLWYCILIGKELKKEEINPLKRL